MFRTFKLGTIFGIPVTAHWSLVFLASWLIASEFKKTGIEGVILQALFIGAIFGSILAHEFGHVLVARIYGIGTTSINLSPLGGIAFLERVAERPGQKAAISVGGPIVSLILAVTFGAWAIMTAAPVTSEIATLFIVNSMLLLFNLLPVYPMDGGQLLNAALEKFTNKKVARMVSMLVGQAGSIAMMLAGLYFQLWSLGLIGMFIFIVVSLEFDSPVFDFLRKKPDEKSPQAVQPDERLVCAQNAP